MLKRRTLKTALAAVISLAVMAAPAYANPGNGNGNGGGNHGNSGNHGKVGDDLVLVALSTAIVTAVINGVFD